MNRKLNVTTGRRKTIQSSLNGLARQHVQNDIDSAIVRYSSNFSVELGSLVVYCVFDANLAQYIQLFRLAGCAVADAVFQARQLQCRETAAAGSGLNQN